jgi:hypothetical protein
MSAEGPSFLNLYKNTEKKMPQVYRGRAIAAVPVPEDPRLKEMATHNVGPISLNGKNLTRTVSGQLERYKQQQNIKRRILAGLPTKEAEEAAKAAAKAAAEAEEGKVEVDVEKERNVTVNFALDQGYMDAIKVPDTYFNIITSSRTT